MKLEIDLFDIDLIRDMINLINMMIRDTYISAETIRNKNNIEGIIFEGEDGDTYTIYLKSLSELRKKIKEQSKKEIKK